MVTDGENVMYMSFNTDKFSLIAYCHMGKKIMTVQTNIDIGINYS